MKMCNLISNQIKIADVEMHETFGRHVSDIVFVQIDIDMTIFLCDTATMFRTVD